MKKRRPKLALHWQILIGLFLGIVFGLLAVYLGWQSFAVDWIKPWGTIFVRLLKLIAIPLIIVSLINGLASLNDITKLSRIGLKVFCLYIATTLIAIVFGLVIVNSIKPGNYLSEAKSMELRQNVDMKLLQEIDTNSGPLDFIVNVVPENIFNAMTNNTAMLQIIFFAIVFGIAIIMLPRDKTQAVRDFIESLNTVVMQMIHIIMLVAPYGVFALIASLIVDISGDNIQQTLSLFGSLGMYMLTVILGLLLLIFVFYPTIIHFLTHLKFKTFLKGISPAQLLAFSTSSSAATLPMTMECCEEKLHIRKDISSFVLPLGATINMDGTSLYQAVAAVFIAQIYGIDLSLAQQLTIIVTALLASIGSAAVPGAGIIMLVIVLNAVGLPTEGVALILAVDRPLDMLRTVVNVTGDATVACVIGCFEGDEK